MRTTGRKQREHVAFAAVLMLIASVCMTVITSCGGGGDGSSDGKLCQQCGDTDGPCLRGDEVSGDDRPDFCGTKDPCIVGLVCLRKLDSAQRRCFPVDPTTQQLDILYRCDGARPNPSGLATLTPTALPTATPLPTVTDTSSPTSPTPEETPGSEEVNVDVSISTDEDTFTSSFVVTVTYPAAKGSFRNGSATDCEPDDDGLVAQDDGNGTLTLTFAGNPDDALPLDAPCVFHQNAGQTLTNADLATSSTSPLLLVETDVL
jgi:hypothetical protein